MQVLAQGTREVVPQIEYEMVDSQIHFCDTTMSPSIPPAKLYKYSPFTAQNLENLKNQQIYFNSPKSFNDPYDCSVIPAIKIPSDDDVECLKAQFLRDTIGNLHHKFLNATRETLREMIVRSAQKTAAAKVKEFSETRGVSCFSEGCDDLLMWAHYGGNYKGFCLEFDTSSLPEFHKVQYSDLMPQFDPVPLLRNPDDVEDDGGVMSMYLSKSRSWAYEKEWRLLHQKAGTLFGYPTEALTGVYFGPEVSNAALEIVCLILRGQNEGVSFWRGARDATRYKVDFAEFDYVPHLQAKESGLITPT